MNNANVNARDAGPGPAPDLMEILCREVPEELRAAYSQEMMHLRSLPENDEMLRILRILMILTKLMVDIPSRILAERASLEALFTRTVSAVENATASSVAWQKQLDDGLRRLPDDIADGIRPETIAAKINESLRQQFAQSTIPQTAQALGAVGTELRKTASDFQDATKKLADSYRGAVVDARRAIHDMNQAVSEAARNAAETAQALNGVFHRDYRRTLYTLCGLSLAIGLILGVLFWQWMDAPAPAPKAGVPAEARPAPRK